MEIFQTLFYNGERRFLGFPTAFENTLNFTFKNTTPQANISKNESFKKPRENCMQTGLGLLWQSGRL